MVAAHADTAFGARPPAVKPRFRMLRNRCLPPAGASGLGSPLDHPLQPPDVRVRPDVVLVQAAGRKLADDGPFVPRLEPVQRLRREGPLHAGLELDLPPDAEVPLVAGGHHRLGCLRRLPWDVQVDGPPAAAEGLLLARVVADRWGQALQASP